MKRDKQYQLQLLNLPIVQKLKTIRGSVFTRKLSTIVQRVQMEQSKIITNINQQTYLILLYEGKLIISTTAKNKKQFNNQQVKKYGYCLVDRDTVKITFEQSSIFFILKEKYILEIFDGIINLPYLNTRIKQLKNVQLFSNIEKRKLNKIAFDLEQIVLHIGSKVQTSQRTPTQIKKYCYFIVSGQIKITHNGIPLCILGPKSIFGILQNYPTTTPDITTQYQLKITQQSIGHIITQRAILYKIPMGLIISNNNGQNSNNRCVNQYINRRLKWRENRLTKIGTIQEMERQKRRKENKSRISFVDKQIAINALYGINSIELKKMKESFKNQYIKCQNRQQYYAKKLDRIKELQEKRYGVVNQTVVFFPIPMNHTLKNMARTLGMSQILSAPSTPSKKSPRISTEPSHHISSSKAKKRISLMATHS